jgi:hypothetical protein
MADKVYRITLWSGGKQVLTHYVKETPKMSDGIVAFRGEDDTIVRLMGTVSIEEGVFTERGITRRG